MVSPPIWARHPSVDLPPRRPLFRRDNSDWLALQPAEQAEVILAAYQERLLPELARMERLLTRLAVEFGLEYCRLDELAVFFLDIAAEIRRHVQTLEAAVAIPPFESVAGDVDMTGLILRLSSVTSRCAPGDEQSSPYYVRLIDGLRQCEQELLELVELELSR